MVQKNYQAETTNSEYPFQGENSLFWVKISAENLKANRQSLNLRNPQMTPKPVPIFGRFTMTLSIVITMNFEFNYLPKEETFFFPLKIHWFLQGLHLLISMCYKERRLTNIGMSIRTSICQDLGQDSQNSLWMRRFQKDTCGLGWDCQRSKRPPDHITYGKKVWTKMGVKLLRSERFKWWKEKPKLENSRRQRNLLDRSRWQRILRTFH